MIKHGLVLEDQGDSREMDFVYLEALFEMK